MADSVQSKHFTKIKLSILFVTILIATGTVSATDLNNIESITPSGTTPISITGDLDLNNNNINNFFGSSCSTGNLAVHVNDDGTLDCVDATSEVQNDFVDRSGDTMTGNLDMQSNYIQINGVSGAASSDGSIGIGSPTVYTNIVEAQTEKGGSSTYIELGSGGFHSSIGADDIGFVTQGTVQAAVTDTGNLNLQNNALNNVDWANSDNPNTDTQNLGTSGNQITLDNGGSVTAPYATDADTLDGNQGSYYLDNTDSQQLSISGDTISLDNGGSVTIQDDFEANTDNQQLSISGDTISLDNGGSVTINDANNHDDQTLSTTADVSGTDDQISITEGNSITIDDDYAANTDASTKCGSDQVLEGGNNCVSNYEAGDDGDSSSSNELQSLSGVVGRGNSISSGQTIDTSAGAFRLPTGADAY